MVFSIGDRLGSYEILSPLGAGGMGEVYRARDSKLGREVALKILPDVFVSDADRVARFQREAHVLASLNHPNIAAIHGLEDDTYTAAAGQRNVRALVLELVEGPTLADRLVHGAMSVDEALAVARQIAAALQAAHDLGIVHRDLKPANVKLRPDGTVKVLDFGLAKAMDSASASGPGQASPLRDSPTITTPAMSQAGVILGTAAYMSPEQARGASVDKRSDVWAFGCVLYELLTGEVPFSGVSVTETLAGVLKSDVDWRRLPAETPDGIHRLLHRCLQKDPKLRLRDMGDAALEIDDARATPSAPPIGRGVSVGERRAWAAACSIAAVVAASALAWIFRPAPPPAQAHLEISTPPTTTPEAFAISPDGLKVVYSGTVDGQSTLWLRTLDNATARRLPGTNDGFRPFWSPDSQSIGFFAQGVLKRIDIAGGSAQVVANALNGYGGTWNRDGTILFVASAAPQPLMQVASSGGTPTAVATTAPRPQQFSQNSPKFLPDGRHFIYKVEGPSELQGIYVADLEDGPAHRLLDAGSAEYQSGRLLFTRQGTAYIQPFDADTLTLGGTAQPFAQQVAFLSSSTAGPFVYRTDTGAALRQLKWLDRRGNDLGAVEGSDGVEAARLSPDGRRIAIHRTVNGNVDIWIVEPRGVRSRLTVDPAVDNFPLWSPDGKRIAFSSTRSGGPHNLFWKPSLGGTEELLLASDEVKTSNDWSVDGRHLLFRSSHPNDGHNLWALQLDDRKLIPIARTRFSEREGTFSPDGKWVAYQSDESGRYEIYVQAFPGEGPKWQISAAGGSQARWRGTGKEVFYVAPDNRLMMVAVDLALDRQAVDATAPVPLFDARVGGPLSFLRHQYDISPDGQRFLIDVMTDRGTASPLIVVLNWRSGG